MHAPPLWAPLTSAFGPHGSEVLVSLPQHALTEVGGHHPRELGARDQLAGEKARPARHVDDGGAPSGAEELESDASFLLDAREPSPRERLPPSALVSKADKGAAEDLRPCPRLVAVGPRADRRADREVQVGPRCRERGPATLASARIRIPGEGLVADGAGELEVR